MKVYRIGEERFINDLSGQGSGYSGGRWNPAGHNALYTSSHCSLAILEIIVYVSRIMFPETFWIAEIETPDNSIKIIETQNLEKNWRSPIPTIQSLSIGESWLTENKFLLLKKVIYHKNIVKNIIKIIKNINKLEKIRTIL